MVEFLIVENDLIKKKELLKTMNIAQITNIALALGLTATTNEWEQIALMQGGKEKFTLEIEGEDEVSVYANYYTADGECPPDWHGVEVGCFGIGELGEALAQALATGMSAEAEVGF